MGNIGNEGEKEMLAFVLMPFDPEFEQIYSEIIVPALESADYEVKRADSTLDQQNIMKNIIPNIVNADLIIAELSSLKPNVLYELGISHALLKPTVLLTQDIEEVPFDLRSYKVVVYSTRFDEVLKLKENLQIIAEKHKHGEIIFGNPVSDFAPKISEEKEHVEDLKILHEIPENMKPLVETEINEDEEPGTLDMMVEGLEGIGEISAKFEKFTSIVNNFADKTKNRVASLSSIKSLDSPESANRAHEIAKEFALDMLEFSDDIESELPEFRSSWEKCVENTTNLFSKVKIETDEDRKAALELIDTTTEFQKAVNGAIKSTKYLKENISRMRGASRDLNRAVNRTDKSMFSLIGELVIGDSYLSRIVNVLEERLGVEGEN